MIYDKEKGGFDIELIFRNVVFIWCCRSVFRWVCFFKSGFVKGCVFFELVDF